MKKILITGSNGFIGQEIMHQALANSELAVVALSRGENRFPSNNLYTYLSVDVCDEGEIENALRRIRPDCVIHTVAMANVDACEKDIASCNKVNIQSVRTLCKLAEEYNFHLIYLSTDFVFDGEDGPYRESDTPNPLNEYGKSKLKAEQLLQSSSCKWSIVRTILVYGAPQEKERSNFILWVKTSLEANKSINVVTDHVRMPTLVNDVAQACLTIAEKEATGIFHVCSEELFSVYEIAQQVAKFWKLDGSLIQPVLSTSLSSSVRRPAYTGFDITKAKRELNFKPRGLFDGLAEIDRVLFS